MSHHAVPGDLEDILHLKQEMVILKSAFTRWGKVGLNIIIIKYKFSLLTDNNHSLHSNFQLVRVLYTECYL